MNIHLYRNDSGQTSIPVTVVASMKKDRKSSATPLVKTDLLLEHVNQEITAFRFTLSEKGNLVPGSINNLPKILRTAGK